MFEYWTRWRLPLLVAVILGSMVALAPGALAATTPTLRQMQPPGAQPLDRLAGDAFDQAFLAQMTMHHAMGVMMARPVVAQGAHQELKDLGARMIADQSGEVEQMRAWSQSWYGLDVACPMLTGMMSGATPDAMPGPMRPGGMMPGPGMPGMMPGATPGMMPGMMPGAGMPMGGMPMGGMPMGGMPMGGMPMMGGLWSLSPEQLDETFMDAMIAHHQGAIEMAALADERAAHQEVKDLAASIISTQTAEIATMRGWLAEWYGR
jgi:uncharacterized protein (DUF305 family)